MTRLERHNRRILRTVGLNPTRMTPAQIERGGKLLAIITREPCGDTRPDRKPAAIEAWRELVNEVLPSHQEREAWQRRQIASDLLTPKPFS
jgi:hypothetical protein